MINWGFLKMATWNVLGLANRAFHTGVTPNSKEESWVFVLKSLRLYFFKQIQIIQKYVGYKVNIPFHFP